MRAGVGGLERLLTETAVLRRYKAADELVRDLLVDVPALVDKYLDHWRAFCANVMDALPDDVLAGRRPVDEAINPELRDGPPGYRERWTRSAESLADLLRGAAELNGRFADEGLLTPVAGRTLKRDALTVARLAKDAEGMTSASGLLAAAVRSPRIDAEAFARGAAAFIPAQAMYEDTWD
ncbi:MAG: hypothetical protein ACRC33_14400 [Gemmataceae bacterium]